MRSAALLLALVPVLGSAQTLTQGERDRAMSELHASRKQFLDALAGLSPAQWNFKPGGDAWSIAECAEHIALSEDRLYDLVARRLMATPAEPARRAGVKGKDALVLEKMPDRSQKAKAPEALIPTHRWPTRDALADHFRESRDRTIAYVQTTRDDLRDHFFEHPALGLLDGYQWLLVISSHTERHLAQIAEVKANPDFPKQ